MKENVWMDRQTSVRNDNKRFFSVSLKHYEHFFYQSKKPTWKYLNDIDVRCIPDCLPKKSETETVFFFKLTKNFYQHTAISVK